MKKNNQFISIAISFFIICFSITSCSNDANQEEKNETNADSVQTEDVDSTVLSNEDNFSFVLPSPIQVAAIFSRAGLKFTNDVLNPVSNLNKYNTKTSQYLNFGVYTSDLAFCVMNDKQQLAIDYLNVIKSLSEDIGMPTIFNEGNLIESFERNIGNKDSILYILSKVKERTDTYLENNSEESKAAIFFAGAWVEGMYIGSNNVKDNDKLKSRLLEQMVILKNLIRALETQNDSSFKLDFVINGLSDIYSTFQSFEGVKKLDQDNMDIFEIEVSNEELQKIKTQVVDLRTKIVEG